MVQDKLALTLMGALIFATLNACAEKQAGSEKDKGETASQQSEVAVSETQGTVDHRAMTFATIDGAETSLADYSGQVVLIVNVASKCGKTPQYAGLQELYETYHDRGFAILGFPANNFGGQEPGSNSEIAEFCSSQYGVTFPMMAKVSVKGEDQHPLFAHLTSQTEPTGDIDWNFHKFLVGKDGGIITRFVSGIEPDNPELVAAIEAAL